MLEWPNKDPDEVLDYAIVWTGAGLGDDKIVATEVVKIKGNVNIDNHSVVDLPNLKPKQSTVTWLSGGVRGQLCFITIRIETESGRVLERTVQISITDK